MSKKPQKHKAFYLILFISIFLFALIAVLFLCFYMPKQQRNDFKHIDSATFDSVFLSMYPIDGYAPEDFSFYRGMTLLQSSYEIPDAAVLEKYLTRIAKSGNTISTIYLGIIPGQIQADELLSILQAYPSVIFEVIPFYPSLSYWESLPEEEYATILSAYQELLTSMADLENIHLFSFFAQEWFIANPANYLSATEITPEIAQVVMLNADRDHPYLITSQNAASVLESFTALTQRAREKGTAFPDLSQWTAIFFGDSIIANYTNSTSVPNVLSGLSGAQVYSYAVGGSSASWNEDDSSSFPKIAEQFLAESTFLNSADPNLCFIINFGLNDYFNGFPVDDASAPFNTQTYAGALRKGIQLLQEAFPNAHILLMSPNFVSYFSNGTEKKSETGGILTEYVSAAETAAHDMNIHYMDNYSGLGITAQNSRTYLIDGCHLNESGRFLLGTKLIRTLADMNTK